jgi:hypothetical protein
MQLARAASTKIAGRTGPDFANFVNHVIRPLSLTSTPRRMFARFGVVPGIRDSPVKPFAYAFSRVHRGLAMSNLSSPC